MSFLRIPGISLLNPYTHHARKSTTAATKLAQFPLVAIGPLPIYILPPFEITQRYPKHLFQTRLQALLVQNSSRYYIDRCRQSFILTTTAFFHQKDLQKILCYLQTILELFFRQSSHKQLTTKQTKFVDLSSNLVPKSFSKLSHFFTFYDRNTLFRV